MTPLTEFQALFFRKSDDVGVVGDEVGVDRRDVAAVDEPQRRVAGGRDPVVLPGLHQADHLVGACCRP